MSQLYDVISKQTISKMAYHNEKNPFYTTEDDDFGFGKPVTGQDTFGSTTSGKNPFGDEGFGGSRYEHIQQMKQNSMNNQLESTQRALASIYDSESMGVATAEELVRQGEQLDNVETKLDKINQDMKTSQKHLNSIKSVFGGIKNWWNGEKKPVEPEKTTSQPAAGLSKALDGSRDAGFVEKGPHPAFRLRNDDTRGFYDEDEDEDLDREFLGPAAKQRDQQSGYRGASGGPRHPTQPAARQQQQQSLTKSGFSAHDEQLEENLDMMSEGMSRLKGLALGLGDEIGRQNDQLEVISSKTDRADISVTDKNRQMRKILR